jgi:hypothetical protein
LLNVSVNGGWQFMVQEKICHNWMADGFAASGRHANITLKKYHKTAAYNNIPFKFKT